jgi:ribosomal protein L11 methyltransferase
MQFDSKNYSHNLLAMRDYALRAVVDSANRTTPLALEKQLVEKFGISKKQIKFVIRELLAEGELAYTYEYGCTFLDRSFNKPVRVSKHIVLKPPGHHYKAEPDDVAVQIKPGVSFGAGNHPTTRLVINGIEYVLLGEQQSDKINNLNVLDIGTGSGILLITAILCGIKRGLGVDIDACARVEAAENLRINGLDDRAIISGQSLADIHGRFAVILANLRFPSLKTMACRINARADIGCFLIFSGIREDELNDLLNVYRQLRFENIWTGNELGWSGVVLRRVK